MTRTWPLFRLALVERKRMLISLCGALIAFETLIVAITAAVPTDQLFAAKPMPNSFQAFSGSSGEVSLASIAGLIGAGMLHPFWIAMQISAIASLGAAVLAADVERGTIELIATRPISIARVTLQRFAAMIFATLLLTVASVLPIAVASLTVHNIRIAIDFLGVVTMTVACFCLLFAFISIAFAAGCAARQRSTVFFIVGGSAALAYAINFVSVAWHPARFAQWITPFHYYRPADALVAESISTRDSLALCSFAIVLLLASLRWARLRDLR